MGRPFWAKALVLISPQRVRKKICLGGKSPGTAPGEREVDEPFRKIHDRPRTRQAFANLPSPIVDRRASNRLSPPGACSARYGSPIARRPLEYTESSSSRAATNRTG